MAQNNDLEPLLSVQQNVHNSIVSSGDTLDSKNLGLLALNTAVLIFVAQLTTVSEHWAIAVLFTLSILLNIAAVWWLRTAQTKSWALDQKGTLEIIHFADTAPKAFGTREWCV